MKRMKLGLLIITFFLFSSICIKAQLPDLTGGFEIADFPATFNSTHLQGAIDVDENGTPDYLIIFSTEHPGATICSAIISPRQGLTISTNPNTILFDMPIGTPLSGQRLQSMSFYLTKILSAGEIIGSSETNWYNIANFFGTMYLDSPAPLQGNFNNGVYAGYVGINFIGLNNQFYYGWLNVTMDPNKNFLTINSAGYNPVPGQPIAAGAGGTAVPVPFIASILGFGLIGGGIWIKRRKRNK
ncbi:MAG: hypothetical protein KA807_04585 [Prolixibacteraceae bacterium]|nr:hypothetical protein [Prolixibacteraceae bacterium]